MVSFNKYFFTLEAEPWLQPLCLTAAAFEKQASHLGLQSEWVTGLKRLGITNLGRLAFSCGQPGTAVPEAEVRALLQRSLWGMSW